MPTKRATSFFLQIASFLVVTATIANAQITVIPTPGRVPRSSPLTRSLPSRGWAAAPCIRAESRSAELPSPESMVQPLKASTAPCSAFLAQLFLWQTTDNSTPTAFKLLCRQALLHLALTSKAPAALPQSLISSHFFSGATSLGSFATAATSTSAFSFIGFSSASSPITSVQIQVTGAIGTPEPLIDNFTVAVPEPSTWILMLGSGTLLLALQRYRRL